MGQSSDAQCALRCLRPNDRSTWTSAVITRGPVLQLDMVMMRSRTSALIRPK